MNGITTRRTFLTHSSLALAGLTARPSLGSSHTRSGHRPCRGRVDPTRRVETDPAVRALALRAVEAAKAAGATYADVRLTRILVQDTYGTQLTSLKPATSRDEERYGVGVRALAGGYWGFAASPYWTPEEMVTLAKTAVAQAKSNALGSTRPVELGSIPVAQGSWVMPVKLDPFTVPMEERAELLGAILERADQYYRDVTGALHANGIFGRSGSVQCTREERAVATSEGSYSVQTVYQTRCDFWYEVVQYEPFGQWDAVAPGPYLAGMGWEMVSDADFVGQLPRLHAQVDEQRRLRGRNGTVGRYDVVFDAASMADLVAASLGPATQLDRALGYEANAGGTSWLDDPLAMLGSYPVGSPLLTLTADRSMAQGLATVKWDDEGVVPEDFTLIKDGVLVDMQTTREQASWLAEYYAKAGKPVRSRGCAAAQDALFLPMQHTPNLAMAPGKEDISFNDLVKDTKKGLAVIGGRVGMDWQGRSGVGLSGLVREIVDGKLGAVVTNTGYLFNTTEFWKKIIAIGGPASAVADGRMATKGEPPQTRAFTVSAVPAKVKDVAFIDPTRKA